MSDMQPIFEPKTVAIVGATERIGSVGYAAIKNILEGKYTGTVYPVHPKLETVLGVKAYPSLLDIPVDEIDLVVVIVGSKNVPAVAEQAAQKKAKGFCVISAGFKEVGPEGAALELEVAAIAKKGGMRMIGPNCLGVINTDPAISMNVTFARQMPLAGNIAFLSQSGALCTSVLDYSLGKNIGFSKFVSFGNKADVTEVDFLKYLKDDPKTDVIMAYLEDVMDGAAFMEICKEITIEKGKPILVVKSGRSEEGAKAAASHTGSLAGNDAVFDAMFKQCGVIRVDSVGDLFTYANAMSRQPLPKNNKVGIISNAGGPGIMTTDACVRYGLSLASLSADTTKKLAECLPAEAALGNPVDVIGDAGVQRYQDAIDLVMADPDVSIGMVILTPQDMTDIEGTAKILPEVSKKYGKTTLGLFMGMQDVGVGIRYLENNGIPNYIFPEEAANAASTMVKFAEMRDPAKAAKRVVKNFDVDKAAVRKIIEEKLAGKDEYPMVEREAGMLLKAYGLPLLKSTVVTKVEDVEAATKEIGFPLVMKIESKDILHKSDAGGVKVGIKTVEEAKEAFETIIKNAKNYKPDAVIDGIYMVQFAPQGQEVIVGSTRDEKFGPMVMFGLGGIFVEALKDVSFRLAPMDELAAEEMIEEIKAKKIIEGFRGEPAADKAAIKEVIQRVAQLVSDNPEIAELDINPLFVYEKGCLVADARIILKK